LFNKLKEHFEGLFERISTTELSGKSLEKMLDEFRLVLIENDIAYEVADYVCATLKQRLETTPTSRLGDKRKFAQSVLHDVLLEVLNAGGKVDLLDLVKKKRESKEPAIMVFVGINGTGKTTTIAKVARYLTRNNYTVVIACADTYRTGSIEQMETHAKRVGVKTIKHQYGADSAAVAFDTVNYARSHGINAVLIDTAGRIQTDKNLMKEMEKIVRISQADLVIFIGDSLAGNDAVSQAKEFSSYVKLNGAILTKLDADAKGGSALSIAYVIRKPVLFLGVGQGYDDLEVFDPERLATQMLKI